MGRLEGKRALVTGGTSGIGYAIANRFLREGAAVVITGRDQGLGLRPEAALRASGQGLCQLTLAIQMRWPARLTWRLGSSGALMCWSTTPGSGLRRACLIRPWPTTTW